MYTEPVSEIQNPIFPMWDSSPITLQLKPVDIPEHIIAWSGKLIKAMKETMFSPLWVPLRFFCHDIGDKVYLHGSQIP